MALYTVYTDEQRQKFWTEQDEINAFFKSKDYIEAMEQEIWETSGNPRLPYRKTMPKKVENGWQFTVTANGKSVVVTVKDSQNEDTVIGKAVAKLFK